MWLYAIRRIAYAVPIALGVSIVCFALVYLAPGDPLSSILPPDASQADIEYLKGLYGFDQPIPVQYLDWLARIAVGDLGNSIQNGQPVLQEIGRALTNTMFISLAAVLIAFSIAVVLGTFAAYHLGTWIDRTVTGLSIVGVSVPNYWFAVLLVIVFAVQLNMLPAMGMGTDGSASFTIFDWQQLKYAVLPVVTMSLVPLGIIMRNTRSAVADVLSQDFVQTLRAKGLSNGAVAVHVVRNALPQVLAVMGLQFGYLVGGSILVETIFNWPGTGYLLGKAILTRDVPVVQGVVLVLSLSFVATNLLVDLIQTAVDPRIKRG
jgi:peptide/nickel transport system permease protein